MKSEQGPFREKNEDSMGALEAPEAKSGIAAVCVVADGLGGHAHGEVASNLAVSLFLNAYRASDPVETNLTPSLIKASIKITLHEINNKINDLGNTGEALHQNPFRAGMGTTLTGVIVVGDSVYFGHIGDSRGYLLQNGELAQITEDHSLVGEQLRNGLITIKEMHSHPMRNILTQALGLGQALTPFISAQTINAGDCIILCSDGIHNFLSDKSIKELVLHSLGDEVTNALVEAAIASGSDDNLTVLLMKFIQD